MIAISFRFLAGRYHATPWGRHVNEGAVEWPPSPWRILRALVATWKRTLPGVSQDQVEPILRTLSGVPEFVLPQASTAHTRHWMPWFKKGPDDRTLVFDTFVVVGRKRSRDGGGWCMAPLLVRWPDASLTSAGEQLLAYILANLNTLGRSESWCEAQLASSAVEPAGLICRPLQGDLPPDHEIVRLLCPDPAAAFADDHVLTATRRPVGGGRRREAPGKPSSLYDPAWNLCMETLQLHKERWSDPPGSRWVPYARPRGCFRIERRPRRRPVLVHVRVARYALDSSVLPLVTATLPVAEAVRRALMGIHGRLTQENGVRGRSEVLSGKDDEGRPLQGHVHAYYLPTDEDGDGRLDHVTVYAPGGFGPDEQRALDRLRTLRTGREGEGRHPLRLVLLAMGPCDSYSAGPLQESTVWISTTPYIATRYAKTRGRGRVDMTSPEARAVFLQKDVGAQLVAVRPDLVCVAAPPGRSAAGGGIGEVTIEPLWDASHVFRVGGRWRPIQFKRFRRKAEDDGGRRLAGAFRLTFPSAVRGPIALGWSSHFGMGLFLPPDKCRPR